MEKKPWEEFMNPPSGGDYPPTAENILREYAWRQDVGSVMRVFGIPRRDVNAALREAGLL